MYAENGVRIVNQNKDEIIRILEQSLPEIDSDTKKNRIRKEIIKLR
jgi:hypothetical protein